MMAMSRKCLAGLSGCRYCGGLPELRKERAHYSLTHEGMTRGKKVFIRCSQCHSKTFAFVDVNQALRAWSNGNVFRPIKPVQNA